MSDLSLFDLTTWTDPRSWIANGARLQQQAETLDLQFRYGPEPHTFRSAVRFLASGDLRVFGELITETGAVRSYETIALTSLDSSQDIASFRSGPAAGIEVLRVLSDGQLALPTPASAQTTFSAAEFQLDRNTPLPGKKGGGLTFANYYDSYISTDETAVVRRFCAPLDSRIPNGSTVRSFAILFSRPSNNNNDIVELKFCRLSLAAGASPGGTEIISLLATQYGSSVYFEKSSEFAEIIDFSQYSYHFWALLKNSEQSGSPDGTRLYGVQVDYDTIRVGQ